MTDPPEADRDTYEIKVSARVHEHLQAMTTPRESTSETLERLLGLTPDPATVAGDDLSTPLPEDPAVPESLALDPTAEPAAVDPEDVPEPPTGQTPTDDHAVEPGPVDVAASLGELVAVLDRESRAEMESLLAAIEDADPETLDEVIELIDDQREASTDPTTELDDQ